MKTVLSLLISVIVVFNSFTQNTNLVFFSEQGEQFLVVLNGVQQNFHPQSNVKVTDLNQAYYKVKIRFVDGKTKDLDKTINFNQGTETTFSIKQTKKGKYVLRWLSELPIQQNAQNDPNQSIVTYSTAPPVDPSLTNTHATNQGNSNQGVTTSHSSNGNTQTTHNQGGNVSMGVNTHGTGIQTGVTTTHSSNGNAQTTHNQGGNISMGVNTHGTGIQTGGTTTHSSNGNTQTTHNQGGNVSMGVNTTVTETQTTGVTTTTNVPTGTGVNGNISININLNGDANFGVNTTVSGTETTQQTTTTTTHTSTHPTQTSETISMGVTINGTGHENHSTNETYVDYSTTGNYENYEYDNNNYTETTTTYQSTFSPSSYSGAVGCSWPMNDNTFAQVEQSIKSKDFESSRETVAKQVIKSNCLSTEQVKRILVLFDFEATRLDVAKFAYGYTFDIGNYFLINDVFDFESSITDLDKYISRYGK
jgi:hypothetical protein